LLRDAQLAVEVSRGAMKGEAGLLRIGFGLPSLATGLPDFIQRFRQRFPGIQISLREMSTPPQLEALQNRTLDMGLFGFQSKPAKSLVFHFLLIDS
jgi:DNA-binding transcriptional LysR family regulator